jgi:DNA-binding CsgD family transcriptional regulator
VPEIGIHRYLTAFYVGASCGCEDSPRRISGYYASRPAAEAALGGEHAASNFISFDYDRGQDRSLTPVERDVVRLVAEGHTNAEFGRRLFISVNTVKKHLSRVYTKVDVDGRADIAAQVARRDL